MPSYLEKKISELNKNEAAAREHYEDLKSQIDLIIQPLEDTFDHTEIQLNDQSVPIINYKNDTEFEKQGIYQRIRQTDNIGHLKE